MKIARIRAREILDSRGAPTVEARVALENGQSACAAVPSGASTGAHEAAEKRDGGARYAGKGVKCAVECVNGPIQDALLGMDARDQTGIDARLIAIDGSRDKAVLGANAILAASLACARVAALFEGMPLYRYIGGLRVPGMPRVMMNVLNGGAHADNNIDIQEFMLLPRAGACTGEAVRMCAEIYRALKGILSKRGLSTAVGDEGGFAPNLSGDEEALELLSLASEEAGYGPGRDVFFALDIAASGWLREGVYVPPKRKTPMSADEMRAYIARLVRAYPIVSVEDGLGEDDFVGFAALTREIGDKCMVVGDDLFVTNPVRIREGLRRKSASAALIKPNQIGTLTETLSAVACARGGGMAVVVSHRSGDTADDFLADLAVGAGAGFLKSGAPARAERTSKYNRLMAIAEEIESRMPS